MVAEEFDARAFSDKHYKLTSQHLCTKKNIVCAQAEEANDYQTLTPFHFCATRETPLKIPISANAPLSNVHRILNLMSSTVALEVDISTLTFPMYLTCS